MKKNTRAKLEAILSLENQGITITEEICAEHGMTMTEFNNCTKTLIENKDFDEANSDEIWSGLKLSYVFLMRDVGCF